MSGEPLKCEGCGKTGPDVSDQSPCAQHFGSVVFCPSCDPHMEFEDCSGQPHSDSEEEGELKELPGAKVKGANKLA
jgi:hypothetical protein